MHAHPETPKPSPRTPHAPEHTQGGGGVPESSSNASLTRLGPGSSAYGFGNCEWCSESFERKGGPWAARFCSRLCSQRAWRAGRAVTSGVIVCAQCGERKMVERLPAKVCSEECRQAWEREKARQWRDANVEHRRQQDRARDRSGRDYSGRVYKPVEWACAECGGSFRPGKLRTRKCEDCRRPLPVLANVTIAGAVRAISDRPVGCRFVAGACRECGESFVVADGRSAVGYAYCSRGCERRASRRAHRDRRRTRKAGGERVFRRKVFERDGWRCRLCGGKVARDRAVPHPKAPTVDHIVPLAEGGQHTYLNVQTAHFICNSLKGASAANDQLRLVA